jgi:hypothetical protein
MTRSGVPRMTLPSCSSVSGRYGRRGWPGFLHAALDLTRSPLRLQLEAEEKELKAERKAKRKAEREAEAQLELAKVRLLCSARCAAPFALSAASAARTGAAAPLPRLAVQLAPI